MEAYPTKLRELVLDAYEQGAETMEIAEDLNVSPSWARRVKQRLREHGLRGAIQQKHGPDPKFGPAHRRELAGLVGQTPDATLAELKAKLSIAVSISTIARTLTDMRLTLKKSRCTPASRRGPT
jgi:transposase